MAKADDKGKQVVDVNNVSVSGPFQTLTICEKDYATTEYAYEGFWDPSERDVEIEEKINKMDPVPIAPKINGEVQIPPEEEKSVDHQLLQDRLKLYDLEEFKILGDGNCQFRSLSDQLFKNQDNHKKVREEVIAQLKSQRQLYQDYVSMNYDEYLKKMSTPGEWGDHLTLQAAADFYGVKIFVITSYKDTCSIEIIPKVEKSKKLAMLSFWAEVHYNSVYLAGDLPKKDESGEKSSDSKK